jgi:hypothetical protein
MNDPLFAAGIALFGRVLNHRLALYLSTLPSLGWLNRRRLTTAW